MTHPSQSDRLREAPGRGRVYACQHCGTVALFQCWHEETGPVRTVAMNARRAAWLRRHGDLEKDRMTFVCDGCGYEGPYEVGMSIGDGQWCAGCSGRTERQVAIARRQVGV